MHRRTVLAASVAVTALPQPAAAEVANPLLVPWTGPYGGTPPFDRVAVADFVPAAEAAMAEELREVDAIATNPAFPPTSTGSSRTMRSSSGSPRSLKRAALRKSRSG